MSWWGFSSINSSMWWDPGFDDPNASDAKSKSRTNRFWTGSEKRILDIQINISPNSREDGQILHYRMQDEESLCGQGRTGGGHQNVSCFAHQYKYVHGAKERMVCYMHLPFCDRWCALSMHRIRIPSIHLLLHRTRKKSSGSQWVMA